MDCVKVVENLSQKEKNSILHVLQRDEKLRQGQEQKISNLKKEINQIRMCSVLRAGDDQTKICLRCHTEMGVIFNRGTLCPSCKHKVCKSCQEVMFNGSWLCKLCYKQRQLKWLTGEWTASFDQNPLRKWASGSDIMKATLQLVPGTTSIDVDESPSNQGNDRQGKKVSRNGVGGTDHSRSRVEAPKEGDQLKLSELFNVLRVKKPEEKVVPETQVRRITSRKYSESDSDSSSSSDGEVRSTSTAPSVTESELDGHRIESPRNLESPSHRSAELPLASRLNETSDRHKQVQKIESPEYRTEKEAQRPKPAPRSPQPAARRKIKSEHLEQENVVPTARPRSKDRRSPRSERVVEGQVSTSRSLELQSPASRPTEDREQTDKVSVHSELNLHVEKTRESLDKKFKAEKSRSQASLDKRSLESERLVKPKSREQLVRKSDDNLFKEPKQPLKSDQKSVHKSINELDNEIGAAVDSARSYNTPDIIIKSSDSSSKLVDKTQLSQNQKDLDLYNSKSIQSKHSIEREQLIAAKEEEGQTEREGSPYSFSMDSLPSSHPSPTFNRSSVSSNPDSDTDSVLRANTRPKPIPEQSPATGKSAKSVPKVGESDDVVVEEISKVKFRRVSKTVGQMGTAAKSLVSPNKNNSPDVVLGQRETQSRGGTGPREEGGALGLSNDFKGDKEMEQDICIKQVKSENVLQSGDVTDLLIKKLERMGGVNNVDEASRSRNKSVDEMSWINEGEYDSRNLEHAQIKSVKRLPRFMTSSVASETDRKPSEADSIEDMIDNMARAHLFVDTNLPARASEADSDIGYNLTPISPFPQELYEKRSGKYNRFAYISDDNLDGDSGDDLLDDDTDIEISRQANLNKAEAEEIKDGSSQQGKKKDLIKTDSLDLILDEQTDYIDGNEQVVELDKEYQNALQLTRKESGSKKANVDSILPECSETDRNANYVATVEEELIEPVKRTSENTEASAYSNRTYGILSTERLRAEQVESVTSKHTKSKPKLKAADSLDDLLDRQGDLVDRNAQNVEFDAELIADLEKNFKETLSLQKEDNTLSKEYAYLGIQHDVNTKKSAETKDDFDSIVGEAKNYLDGKREPMVLVAKPKLQCMEYIKHECSADSSDSDILSVIEEAEDERIESSDEDIEHKEMKGQAEPEISPCSVNNQMHLQKIDTSQKEEFPTKSKDLLEESDSDTRAKDDKNAEIEKAVRKLEVNSKVKEIDPKGKMTKTVSSPTEATLESDMIDHGKRNHEKYRKIHDHWLAVEKHEADILDFDELDGDSAENMPPCNEGIEKTSVNSVEEGSTLEDVETKSVDISYHMDDLTLPSETNDTKYKNGAKMDEERDELDDKGNTSVAETERNLRNDVILNSTLNDSRPRNNAHINDSDPLCHSISDISSTISCDQERSPIVNQSMTSDTSKPTSLTVARDFCHSLPDMEKELGEFIVTAEVTDMKLSINDSKAICESISELEEPIVENIADEQSAQCFGVPPVQIIGNSQLVKDDVFDSKIIVAEPDNLVQAGSRKRVTSDEIRIELKAMQQSQKKYKTEVEFLVDRSGKVTPPASTSNDPKFFKAPEKPPRIKKQTSSSSGLSSPDISADKAYMDSHKSEKLTSSHESPRTLSECSVSQDDSGNVSGGSRGTTPEHRRTDSSYSQSSLPSTLSNVTDEEEDIDRIVAKVQRQSISSRGSNLLSVFGDSRESLASYYSDAGDITYSNVPITGEVLFSLNYNYKTNMLEVGVKQCRNIAVADTKRRRSDPYVKTYMLPDRTRGGKRKTKVKKHTTSPTFDETLKYSLTKSELENRTLWLTVWHNDRFGRNVFLGEVTINFDYYKFEDPFPKWYPLQERMDAPPQSMMVYKGDLSVCIRFVPADKLGASPAPTGKRKDTGKGQLQVMVKEARNLTGVKSNGFSDPFCKAYLLPERHKSSKQKTAVIKKDCSPVWNHTFIFEDVTLMELRERCLELTIWDYEKLTSNDFLGGVRLNLGTGVSGGKPVDWMDARGEEMSMWQAMLDRPNIWIDGALILRPNMEKRKF